MKKIGYFTCAALLALGSCTNEINEEGFVDKANTISFSAYSNKTRAVTGDVTSANMKGDNFGVMGYYNNSPYLYKLENTIKTAVEQTWTPDAENSSTGTWEYKNEGDIKFWPDRNASMEFYAYFPYSDNATFAESCNSAEAVMTIPGLNCKHDVLFAKTTSNHADRVPLTFHHAFSKINSLKITVNGGNVGKADVQVIVSDVEFINTSTSGSVKVNNSGTASYKKASTNVTLKKSFPSTTTINKSLTTGVELISDADHGYLFATNSSSVATNSVYGTGNTLWDGNKSSLEGGNLSEKSFVCLKLTCKVKDSTHYLVGDDNTYGYVYIPLMGSGHNNNNSTTIDVKDFLAGKRYNYNIVFSHNVGFKDNGDPILDPILFNVSSVDDWDDVNITITL